jgi:hypothetical protein
MQITKQGIAKGASMYIIPIYTAKGINRKRYSNFFNIKAAFALF